MFSTLRRLFGQLAHNIRRIDDAIEGTLDLTTPKYDLLRRNHLYRLAQERKLIDKKIPYPTKDELIYMLENNTTQATGG